MTSVVVFRHPGTLVPITYSMIIAIPNGLFYEQWNKLEISVAKVYSFHAAAFLCAYRRKG